METKNTVKLDAVRQKLGASVEPEYWKSFDQLVETDDFKLWLEDEFPHRSSILDIDRRTFLKLAGASFALAGLAGCRSLPQEKLIPYVKAPEDLVLGNSQYYASAFLMGGYATGVLVETHEGRPTKIEGHPDHPASLGSSDAFAQASILSMYDPDRETGVTRVGLENEWDSFFAEAATALKSTKASRIAILTETVTSPMLAVQLRSFMQKFPGSRWVQYDSVCRDNIRSGAEMAFGQPVDAVYDFTKARRVVSFDADFLTGMPGSVRYARDVASLRNLDVPERVSRIYSFASAPNLVSAIADHSWALSPAEICQVAQALLSRLGGGRENTSKASDKVLDAIASDLQTAGGECVVIPGFHLPAECHAICHKINEVLGSMGSTVRFIEPVQVQVSNQVDDLKSLVDAMKRRQIDTLLILGGNPVYTAPSDLEFGKALGKVKHSWRLGLYDDETSEKSVWHLPEAHPLESWGDAKAFDGTVTMLQPTIEPLYGGMSASEVLTGLLGKPMAGLDLLQAQYGITKTNQKVWRTLLDAGFVDGGRAVTVGPCAPVIMPGSKEGLQVAFLPDPTVWDGSFANNGWLQELPKPLTKLTWDNAVFMSPKRAEELGVSFEDVVKVTVNGRSVEGSVFIQPGHADGSITLHLGYGRTKGGKVAKQTGFDAGSLRTSDGMYVAVVSSIVKTGKKIPLASAQSHHSMEGRDIVREGSLAEYLENPALVEEEHEDVLGESYYNLTAEWAKEGGLPQWGMAIDLNTCTGCNACVTACQAENNIPTVGKVEVLRGRELHWIRIDRYYRVKEGKDVRDVRQVEAENGNWWKPGDEPSAKEAKRDVLDPSLIETVFQPVTCMHCEVAPCEPVCPVAATVHSHEGLNQMVYNRCVGTRYCSNNCPYKVRRFNYHNYQHGQMEVDLPIGKQYGNRNFEGEKDIPLLKLLNNPNVTVRSRGVMEKCTYCVQRINEARITAKKDMRDIRDGEIVTACQQACPSRAITFGNIADKNSAVSKRKAEKRNYSLLKHLNTVPRTTYLGKVRNPNHEVEA